MADEDSRLKDKRLDFLSDKFDPLRALYTKELQPPIPNIQVFNNLAEYARIIKEGKTKTQPSVAAALKVGPSRRTRNLKPEFKPPDIGTRLKAIASEQNQGDLASKEKLDALGGGPPFSCGKTGTTLGLGTENRWKKKYKNVLERMEECVTGPFSILYKCLKERYKIQVWIRKYKGLRSVLTGYVIAFDKHMNLALMDVDELYTVEELQKDDNTEKDDPKTRKKKKKKKKKRKKSLLERGDESPMDGCQNKENKPSLLIPSPQKSQRNGTPDNTCTRVDSVSFLRNLSLNSVSSTNMNLTATESSERTTDLSTTSCIDEQHSKHFNIQELPISSVECGAKEKTQDSTLHFTDTNQDSETDVCSFQADINLAIVERSNSASTEGQKLTILQGTELQDDAEICSFQTDLNLAIEERSSSDTTEGEKIPILQEIELQDQSLLSSDSTDGLHFDCETPSYLFSHDLTVRVPAHDDDVSRDMEFTLVGIFQPKSNQQSIPEEEGDATLPDGLRFQVPLTFPQHLVTSSTASSLAKQHEIPSTEDKGSVNLGKEEVENLHGKQKDPIAWKGLQIIDAASPSFSNTQKVPSEEKSDSNFGKLGVGEDLKEEQRNNVKGGVWVFDKGSSKISEHQVWQPPMSFKYSSNIEGETSRQMKGGNEKEEIGSLESSLGISDTVASVDQPLFSVGEGNVTEMCHHVVESGPTQTETLSLEVSATKEDDTALEHSLYKPVTDKAIAENEMEVQETVENKPRSTETQSSERSSVATYGGPKIAVLDQVASGDESTTDAEDIVENITAVENCSWETNTQTENQGTYSASGDHFADSTVLTMDVEENESLVNQPESFLVEQDQWCLSEDQLEAGQLATGMILETDDNNEKDSHELNPDDQTVESLVDQPESCLLEQDQSCVSEDKFEAEQLAAEIILGTDDDKEKDAQELNPDDQKVESLVDQPESCLLEQDKSCVSEYKFEAEQLDTEMILGTDDDKEKDAQELNPDDQKVESLVDQPESCLLEQDQSCVSEYKFEAEQLDTEMILGTDDDKEKDAQELNPDDQKVESLVDQPESCLVEEDQMCVSEDKLEEGQLATEMILGTDDNNEKDSHEFNSDDQKVEIERQPHLSTATPEFENLEFAHNRTYLLKEAGEEKEKFMTEESVSENKTERKIIIPRSGEDKNSAIGIEYFGEVQAKDGRQTGESEIDISFCSKETGTIKEENGFSDTKPVDSEDGGGNLAMTSIVQDEGLVVNKSNTSLKKIEEKEKLEGEQKDNVISKDGGHISQMEESKSHLGKEQGIGVHEVEERGTIRVAAMEESRETKLADCSKGKEKKNENSDSEKEEGEITSSDEEDEVLQSKDKETRHQSTTNSNLEPKTSVWDRLGYNKKGSMETARQSDERREEKLRERTGKRLSKHEGKNGERKKPDTSESRLSRDERRKERSRGERGSEKTHGSNEMKRQSSGKVKEGKNDRTGLKKETKRDDKANERAHGQRGKSASENKKEKKSSKDKSIDTKSSETKDTTKRVSRDEKTAERTHGHSKRGDSLKDSKGNQNERDKIVEDVRNEKRKTNDAAAMEKKSKESVQAHPRRSSSLKTSRDNDKQKTICTKESERKKTDNRTDKGEKRKDSVHVQRRSTSKEHKTVDDKSGKDASSTSHKLRTKHAQKSKDAREISGTSLSAFKMGSKDSASNQDETGRQRNISQEDVTSTLPQRTEEQEQHRDKLSKGLSRQDVKRFRKETAETSSRASESVRGKQSGRSRKEMGSVEARKISNETASSKVKDSNQSSTSSRSSKQIERKDEKRRPETEKRDCGKTVIHDSEHEPPTTSKLLSSDVCKDFPADMCSNAENKVKKVGLLPTPVMNPNVVDPSRRFTAIREAMRRQRLRRRSDEQTSRLRGGVVHPDKLSFRGGEKVGGDDRSRSCKDARASTRRMESRDSAQKEGPSKIRTKKRTLPQENVNERVAKRQKIKSEIKPSDKPLSKPKTEHSSSSEIDPKNLDKQTKGASTTTPDDIGGVGANTVGASRRIEIGKGRFLTFKRRHVNQLFVRGDNVVMIAYAST